MSVQDELAQEFPSFHLVRKSDYRFYRYLDFLVKLFTGNRDFLISVTTTIGPIVGVGSDWDLYLPEQRDTILAHERVHLRQQRTMGLGLGVWAGLVPWALVWLLLPLPAGLAWGRYALERAAYLETLRRAPEQLEDVVSSLSGSAYAWCWRAGWARAWFKQKLGV